MKLITAAQGSAHITPLQDSMWHRGLAGVESCVFDFGDNFEPTISSNTLVRLGSGVGQLQGRYFAIEPNTYDEVAIANGSQGVSRIDLICAKITVNGDTGTQTGSWEVLQGADTTGTPVAPAVPEGDLDNGDTEAYYPVAQVNITGINIESVAMIADILTNLSQIPPAVDYIVEEGGTQNEWWIKRNSGRAEYHRYIEQSFSGATQTGITGAGYGYATYPTLPEGLFLPGAVVHLDGQVGSGSFITTRVVHNANNTLTLNWASNLGNGNQHKLHISVFGWWKTPTT